jgi:hypothetical protein
MTGQEVLDILSSDPCRTAGQEGKEPVSPVA